MPQQPRNERALVIYCWRESSFWQSVKAGHKSAELDGEWLADARLVRIDATEVGRFTQRDRLTALLGEPNGSQAEHESERVLAFFEVGKPRTHERQADRTNQ
jgi:hypothetical protein